MGEVLDVSNVGVSNAHKVPIGVMHVDFKTMTSTLSYSLSLKRVCSGMEDVTSTRMISPAFLCDSRNSFLKSTRG